MDLSNVSIMHSPTNSCAKHQQQSPSTTSVNLHVTSTPGLCHLKTCFRRTGNVLPKKEIIPLQSLAPSTVFRQELSEEDCDTQSEYNTDATVQGGICALDVFELREKQIIDIKRKKNPNKPRKTVSKLVSGRELTNDTVMANIAEHEKKLKKQKH